MPVLKHLVCQIQHGDIELYTQKITGIGKIVEKIRIPAFKMYRHNIALGFNTLGNERFFPCQVLYNTMLTTGAYPGGKHNDVAVGTESLFHHAENHATAIRSC